MITLQLITKDNWFECTKLAPKDDQKEFVAPNVFSMAQSKFFPETEIRAIYAGETLVGFIMWGLDPDQPVEEMWVWRLMIDAAHQGQGYGRAAMQDYIAQQRAAGTPAIYLSYSSKNTGGAAFYRGLGFVETGRIEHGEIVVRSDLTTQE